MPFGLQYQSFQSATARWSVSGEQVDASCTGMSIISQRDADRKALDCARDSAQAMLKSSYPDGAGLIEVTPPPEVGPSTSRSGRYNDIFFKTDTETARCLAGTGSPTSYTASAESIISQRDVDRKAVDWAKAAAQSMLRCAFTTYTNDTPGETTVVCSGGSTFRFTVPVGTTQSIRSQAEANDRAQEMSLQLAQGLIDSGCLVVAPPTLSFRQYDGPIVYPVEVLVAGDEFYLAESIDGTAKTKHSPKATNVASKACSITGTDAASGVISSAFSGERRREIGGSETNTLSVSVLRSGGIGAYDFPGDPGILQIVTAGTADDLITAAVAAGGTFLFPDYVEYVSGDRYIKEWRAVGDSSGYFAGQFGGPYDYTWCPGQGVAISYTERVSPAAFGTPVARTGEPARTQSIASTDAGTRTRTGTVSEVNVSLSVLPTEPTVTLILTYRVTPIVGDPYDLVVLSEEPITGSTLSKDFLYPSIVGASVYLTSVSFDYRVAVVDDFAGRESEEDVVVLAGSSGWLSDGKFVALPPNTECWDDFTNYTSGSYQRLVFGRQWSGDGTCRSSDPTQAYDDFSGYASSTLSVFAQGFGWSEYGASQVGDFVTAYDDFAAYANGDRSTFDFFGAQNQWSLSGTSAVADFRMAYDDFNSYVSSSRDTFDFYGSVFTGSTNEWSADGTSAVAA